MTLFSASTVGNGEPQPRKDEPIEKAVERMEDPDGGKRTTTPESEETPPKKIRRSLSDPQAMLLAMLLGAAIFVALYVNNVM